MPIYRLPYCIRKALLWPAEPLSARGKVKMIVEGACETAEREAVWSYPNAKRGRRYFYLRPFGIGFHENGASGLRKRRRTVEARYGCSPENRASVATARSVGFVPYGTSLVLSAPAADLET